MSTPTARIANLERFGLALLIAAIAAEIAAVHALGCRATAAALLLHGAGALGMGAAVWLELARGPRDEARTAAIATACIAGCLPAVGLVGILAVALPGWLARTGARPPKLIERPMPRFSEDALDVRASLVLPVTDALSPSCDVEARIAAVKALRNMEATRAIPLLRRALSDPAEDVRLLAHAILDRRERAIRARLEASLTLLESATKEHEGGALRRAHAELASHYWELAYAGFVSGESARAVLDKAARHALAAAAYPGERTAILIAIRAYLKLAQHERAQQALAWARSAGIPAATLAPLAAELAFLQRRFGSIDGALAQLSPLSARQPNVAQVARFWTARGTP